jgi:hypothetical protein
MVYNDKIYTRTVSRETGVAEKPVIFGRAHSLVRAGVYVTRDAGQGMRKEKSAHWVNLPPCPSMSQHVSHLIFKTGNVAA